MNDDATAKLMSVIDLMVRSFRHMVDQVPQLGGLNYMVQSLEQHAAALKVIAAPPALKPSGLDPDKSAAALNAQEAASHAPTGVKPL